MNPAAQPDAKIFERVASLKAEWSKCDDTPMTGKALTEHLERNFNAPERELRNMRPATVAGALAKLEFFQWDAEVSISDEPLERGITAAIADLKALLAARGAP